MVIICEIEILCQLQDTPFMALVFWKGRKKWERCVFNEVRRIKYRWPCQHFPHCGSIFLHLPQPHISPKIAIRNTTPAANCLLMKTFWVTQKVSCGHHTTVFYKTVIWNKKKEDLSFWEVWSFVLFPLMRSSTQCILPVLHILKNQNKSGE